MTRIRIYTRPDCPSCLRRARMYLFFDWLHRVVISTANPPGGPLAERETIVQDLDTGQLLRGAAAFDCICRHIPVYAPMRLLLRIPAIRDRADRTMAGQHVVSKEKEPHITRRWR